MCGHPNARIRYFMTSHILCILHSSWIIPLLCMCIGIHVVMCVSVYVCMCVCVRASWMIVGIRGPIRTSTNKWDVAGLLPHTHACTCTHARTHIQLGPSLSIYVCVRVYVRVHACVCTCACVCVCGISGLLVRVLDCGSGSLLVLF